VKRKRGKKVKRKRGKKVMNKKMRAWARMVYGWIHKLQKRGK